MSPLFSRLAIVCIALIVGNFLYALFVSRDWKSAFERSFFQIIAVIVVYLNTESLIK